MLLIYLFAVCLCCCTWAFPSCTEWGLLIIAVHGLLIAQFLLLQSTGPRVPEVQQLKHVDFSSCGPWALEHGRNSCGA